MLYPFHDNVIVKMDKPDETNEQGIILPDSAEQEPPLTGEVIAIGPGRIEDGKLIPVSVVEGARVYVRPRYGVKIFDKGEEFLLVDDRAILAAIE